MLGTGYVRGVDVSEVDKAMLDRLWSAVDLLAAESPTVERVNSLSGPVWLGIPGRDDALLEALDSAQAELQVGFRAVADHMGAQASDCSPGWRRVAAWFAAEKAREARRAQGYRAGAGCVMTRKLVLGMTQPAGA